MVTPIPANRPLASAPLQAPRGAAPAAQPAPPKRFDHPELDRLARDLKPGDILLVCYNAPGEAVAAATQGPFSHALVYVGGGRFVEAIGITGGPDDPKGHQVRPIAIEDALSPWHSYRIVRPAEHLPEPQRSQAVQKAVAWARAQIGKPYDYTFGEDRAGASFYCSSLAYQAYAVGAGVAPALNKDPRRDVLMSALDRVLDALEPDDRAQVADLIGRFISSNPSPEQLTAFIVDQVLPRCAATRGLVQTPEQRAAILDVARNGAFPNAGKADGWLDWLTGGAADLWHLTVDTGLLSLDGLSVACDLLAALYPLAEALAARTLGADSTAATVLGWLPGTGDTGQDPNFVSPTDLGWAPGPRRDYNVRPGSDLDRPL